jgi:2-hydroxychromene-2-carboxylate isomerase
VQRSKTRAALDGSPEAATLAAMTMAFDFYFSFRSPYSYLATPMVEALMQRYDFAPRMRVVLPIALRIPGFFKTVNPLWPPYLLRDTFRISQMHNIPYRWPRPDPIIMDIGSGEVAAEQPYIHRVSRMAVAAEHADRGFQFVRAGSRKIWSGEVDAWHEGNHLADAATEAGLDARALTPRCASAATSLPPRLPKTRPISAMRAIGACRCLYSRTSPSSARIGWII